MRKITAKAIALLITLAATLALAQEKSTLTDPRDKKTYKTAKIGTQVWMAENLNYAAKGSKCYDNNQANCKKYGRLYDFEMAKKACPSGWHLPNDAEWNVLMTAVGGDKTAGKYLKATSGWNSKEGKSGNGEDKFGFSALPGGDGDIDDYFGYVGFSGYWWSASEDDSGFAYFRGMYYDYEYAHYNSWSKYNLSSVRCIQN
jgi:uncharacterized protein (TIGR02145 family)